MRTEEPAQQTPNVQPRCDLALQDNTGAADVQEGADAADAQEDDGAADAQQHADVLEA